MQNNRKNRRSISIEKVLFGFFVIVMLLLPSVSVQLNSNYTLGVGFNNVEAKNFGTSVWDFIVGDAIRTTQQAVGSLTKGGIAWISDNLISKLFEILLELSVFLVALAVSVVNMVTSPVLFEEVFFSPQAVDGINTGWGLVRDFVNMFFILILVFLAIATILRVNRFADKKMLISVIFAAILVNFSKPITMFLVDLSNLTMSFFMQNISGSNRSFGGALIDNMGYGSMLKAVPSEAGGWYVAVMMLIVFNVVLAIMLFFLAIALIIRLIALCVLIVLSPLAFFGIALPGTFLTTIKNAWIKKLVHWLFFGPVMLFFLWLALVMVSAVAEAVRVSGDYQLSLLSLEGVTDLGGILIPFIVCIYMLFYGYSLSKSIADGAGSSVSGILGKGGDWARKSIKYSAGAAGLAATGVVGGVGGYLGYKAGQSGVRNAKEGISGNKNIPFTKAWQDERNKKGKRKWTEVGNKDEKRKNFASDVNDNLKQVDERGMSDDELKNWQEKGTQTEKAAASLRLAKDGKLSHADGSYKRAVASMADNPGMLKRLEDNAKRNNKHAMIEHAIEQRTSERRSGDLTKSKDEIIREEYEKGLKDLSLSQIAEQGDDLHNSKEFHAFMKKKVASKGFTEEKLRKTDKLSPEKAEIWEKENFFAGPERENLSKRGSNDAMRDMNR